MPQYIATSIDDSPQRQPFRCASFRHLTALASYEHRYLDTVVKALEHPCANLCNLVLSDRSILIEGSHDDQPSPAQLP